MSSSCFNWAKRYNSDIIFVSSYFKPIKHSFFEYFEKTYFFVNKSQCCIGLHNCSSKNNDKTSWFFAEESKSYRFGTTVFFPDHLASQPELLYKSNQSKDSNLTACSINVFLRILHMSALRFSLIINHRSYLCALILKDHFVGKKLLPDCCLICLQKNNRFTFRPC